jgi:hypothetical protein
VAGGAVVCVVGVMVGDVVTVVVDVRPPNMKNINIARNPATRTALMMSPMVLPVGLPLIVLRGFVLWSMTMIITPVGPSSQETPGGGDWFPHQTAARSIRNALYSPCF